ncbi:hypothetical protein CAPTEDRAFT_177283 [Capitella teleta]|uniref:Kaptin n=1 Tax=Capitella teleta TaxID=283909 RepID=R7TSS2_CAPTE|nr:hypothetical protein CAPTEDRAFT_177283 [Capitella teleta]|eukprot:ELT94536.1 hypothetical protein CAPTEDRAFT_177283 [Capitella teleta]
MSLVECPLQEAHYCSLDSQTSVYGLAKFTLPCGTMKLLIASVEGKVMSLEYQRTTPSSRAMQLQLKIMFDHVLFLSGDATIIAIDSFNKSFHGNGVVIGVTFSKTNSYVICFYLNIYSEWEFGAEFDLNRIVQGCQNLELNFIPSQLTHTELIHAGNTEVVFLLTGNDQKIHLFREDRMLHTFHEEQTEEFFPEFADIPSNVTWLDVQYLHSNTQRLSALGCQNGLIQITFVNVANRNVLNKWVIQHDAPITSINLFTLFTDIECPSFVSQVLETEEDGFEIENQEFNLLVSSATESTVVYRNILERGFSDPLVLPESERYDFVLSSLVADIDFDGQNEVILGTYGQELLAYKFNLKAGSKPEESASESHNRSCSSLHDGEFKMIWQRSFCEPLLGLDEVDITGDGVNEVIIVTLKGLHILQHDPVEVQKLCLTRMKAARDQHSCQEDMFTQLLAENLSSDNASADNISADNVQVT